MEASAVWEADGEWLWWCGGVGGGPADIALPAPLAPMPAETAVERFEG